MRRELKVATLKRALMAILANLMRRELKDFSDEWLMFIDDENLMRRELKGALRRPPRRLHEPESHEERIESPPGPEALKELLFLVNLMRRELKAFYTKHTRTVHFLNLMRRELKVLNFKFSPRKAKKGKNLMRRELKDSSDEVVLAPKSQLRIS